MFSSLVAAIVPAIIHHFFYLHFNHGRVDESIGKQWLSRIGTAFAFLVKMFAAIAAGIAYVQRQWLVFQSQPFRLDDFDSMFDVLSDVTGFLDFGIWVRNPVLTFLALIPWSVAPMSELYVLLRTHVYQAHPFRGCHNTWHTIGAPSHARQPYFCGHPPA